MRIILLKKYKLKIAVFFIVTGFWLLLAYMVNIALNNQLSLDVTINDQIAFSYPVYFEINNIYVSDNVKDTFVTVNNEQAYTISDKHTAVRYEKGHSGFEYPSALNVNQTKFAGSEILYHIDFNDKSKNVIGFVQVWNMPYPIVEFLDKSIQASNFSSSSGSPSEIGINGMQGYYWDYLYYANNENYRSLEVYLANGNKMLRVSYFIPESDWSEKASKTFLKIVNSISIK